MPGIEGDTLRKGSWVTIVLLRKLKGAYISHKLSIHLVLLFENKRVFGIANLKLMVVYFSEDSVVGYSDDSICEVIDDFVGSIATG
jgi:hypothetical protein